LFETAWILGDLDVRRAQLEPMSQLAEQLKQPAQRWLVLTCRTMLALSAGQFEAAEELMEETLSVGRQAQAWGAVAAHTLQSFVLLREKGRLEELRGVVTEQPERFPSKLVQRAVSAHLDGQLGHRDEARRALTELLAEDLSKFHVDEEWLFAVSLLADPCALVGDGEIAASLYALLRPYAGLNAVAPPEVALGAVDRSLGVLATLLGYWDEAGRHFEDALAMNERMGARPSCAHTLHDHACMLLARRQAGDPERAARLLGDARALYGELGMTSWVGRAEALAEQLAGRS
jgi:tetratricopeptide (TPR) repeat protein